MTGIYKIENKHNGKVYIGKSKDIMQRWSAHERALAKQEHHSKKLQEDYNIYGGIQAFDFSIVEICSAEELSDKENFYIQKFDSINNGYNMTMDTINTEKKEITITNKAYKELQMRLGSSYIMTFLYLKFNSDDNNQIVLNQTALADYFGINTITVQKHIRILLNEGIIKMAGKKGLFNIYEILI